MRRAEPKPDQTRPNQTTLHGPLATMSFETDPGQTEVPFAPSYVHRLIFTNDLLGADQEVLAGVLEPSGARAARVQFWVDEHVMRGQADLRRKLRGFAAAHAGRVELA